MKRIRSYRSDVLGARTRVAGTLVVAAVLCASPLARAADSEFEEGKKREGVDASAEAKVPWRGSALTYENIVSAVSLSRGAELTYNPYYAQSFSFRPRYYVRDDLSLRARLDLEVELTTSDETDRAREWVVSDLLLDAVYGPSWAKIPVVDVDASVNLRLTFPASKVSRGHSMMLGIGPGFSLKREFSLMSGRFLRSVGVLYAFRGTKYLNEYTTAQLNTEGVCPATTNPNNPACLHGGRRNVSWRLTNFFEARLEIMRELSLTADVFLFNDLLYGLDGGEVELEGGASVVLDESNVDHRGAAWVIVDLSYDVVDWLSLSLGLSTYYPHLRPDSSYYGPFNRFTAVYFDVTVPVDRFVAQVQKWTGWGQ